MCQISTVRVADQQLRNANRGVGAAGYMTDREYVHDMFEKRRAAGLPDPEPENKKAAALAPAKGSNRKVGE